MRRLHGLKTRATSGAIRGTGFQPVSVPVAGTAAGRRRLSGPFDKLWTGPSTAPAAAAAVLRREARPYVARRGSAAFSRNLARRYRQIPAGALVVTEDGKHLPLFLRLNLLDGVSVRGVLKRFRRLA